MVGPILPHLAEEVHEVLGAASPDTPSAFTVPWKPVVRLLYGLSL